MEKARILIVEDEAIVAEDLKMILGDIGYDVVGRAASAGDAIQKALELRPDLVLMDIVLRGKGNGIDASCEIKEKMDIPIIFLTAYSNIELIDKAKSIEPYAYIVKPLQERQLLASIEIALYKSRMEKRLKESEEWLSTTLKSIGDAVIATDSKGCVKFINPVAEGLTGWKGEDAEGKMLEYIFNIVDEKTGEDVENPVNKVIREGVVVGLANHTVLIAKDGRKIPIDDSGAPIKDDDGRITGVVLVFRDITERRQAEEALTKYRDHLEELVKERTHDLETAQQELIKRERLSVLGLLTATVSHELRNPLGVIGSSIFYLQRKLAKEDEKTTKHLKRIQKQVDLCDSIVGELLEYTRGRCSDLLQGKINPWLEEILKQITVPKQVVLVRELSPGLPIVRFDRGKMRRVVTNLLQNALQAVTARLESSKEEDAYQLHVKVATSAAENGVCMEVEDNGIGMDQETVTQAFEPLFTTSARGTGLGLAIVRKIVEEHGGSVSLESTPERGTKVTLVIPAEP